MPSSTNDRFQDPESEDGQDLASRFLAEANKAILSEGPSLELVQAHLLLSIANYSLGNGRKSWHELGIHTSYNNFNLRVWDSSSL